MSHLNNYSSICVLGLGKVGLPLACIIADHGYRVYGVDIDSNLIHDLQRSSMTIHEKGLKTLLEKVIRNRKFSASTKIIKADIYIVAVPTPILLDTSADLSFIFKAIDMLKEVISVGSLVLLESTLPIGSTLKIAKKMNSFSKNIYIAYSPERAIPGNTLYEMRNNDRIVGGIDKESSERATAFYQSIIKGKVLTTDSCTAEAVKLTENTYRDINIAYANEISMLLKNLELDYKNVIKLANHHPRVNIMNPGIGVGGHCIPIDSWFLAGVSKSLSSLITAGRKVNIMKTGWILDILKKKIRGTASIKIVACLGVTYKENVDDIRESPAMYIVNELQKYVKVLWFDPYIPSGYSLTKVLNDASLIIKLVSHKEFINLPVDIDEKEFIDVTKGG